MKWLGCLLAMFAVQGQVFAGGCRFNSCGPVYHASVYHAPAVIEKIIYVTEYKQLIAYVPVALATYQPIAAIPAVPLAPLAPVPPAPVPALPAPVAQLPVAVPTPDPCAVRMAPLLARLEVLERRLALPPKEMAPLPKEAAPMLAKGVGMVQAKCAKCHTTTTAEKQGGGFVMFDQGQMVQLSDRQALLCFKHVIKGVMPPPSEGKMSEEDGRAVAEFWDTYQSKK